MAGRRPARDLPLPAENESLRRFQAARSRISNVIPVGRPFSDLSGLAAEGI
jgi:hypothetical protein